MKATPEQVAALMASGWVDGGRRRVCIPNRATVNSPLQCTFHAGAWGERGCERAAAAADVVMALVLGADRASIQAETLREAAHEADSPINRDATLRGKDMAGFLRRRADRIEADVVVQAGEVEA